MNTLELLGFINISFNRTRMGASIKKPLGCLVIIDGVEQARLGDNCQARLIIRVKTVVIDNRRMLYGIDVDASEIE